MLVGGAVSAAALDLSVSVPAGQDAGQSGSTATATIQAAPGLFGRQYQCQWTLQQPLGGGGSGGIATIQIPGANATVTIPGQTGQRLQIMAPNGVWSWVKQMSANQPPFYVNAAGTVFMTNTNPPSTVTSAWTQVQSSNIGLGITPSLVDSLDFWQSSNTSTQTVNVRAQSNQFWLVNPNDNQVYVANNAQAAWPGQWSLSTQFSPATVNTFPFAQVQVQVTVRTQGNLFWVVNPANNQVFWANNAQATWPGQWTFSNQFTAAQVNGFPAAQINQWTGQWQTVTNPSYSQSPIFGNNSVFAITNGNTNTGNGQAVTSISVPNVGIVPFPVSWRIVPACAIWNPALNNNQGGWGQFVASTGQTGTPIPTPTPTPTPPAENRPAWCVPSNTNVPASQRNANNFGDRLNNTGSNRNRLREGEWLVSQNCNFGMTVRASDGNVILVRLVRASGDTNVIRAANISTTLAATNQTQPEFGRSPGSLVLRRSDGQLIQYLGAENSRNWVAWNGTPGAGSNRTLVLQNDGNLVMFGSGSMNNPSNAVWARYGLSSNNNTGEQAFVSGNRFARTRFFALNNR
jgi:hypothetical protein